MAKVKQREWTTKAGKTKTAWIADYFDGEGKRRLKTFATKKAADAWLVTARGEIAQGTHTPASTSITVARAGEDWIAQGETDGLERSTIEQYRQHLGYHIKPFIGAVRLTELTPAGIQDFRNTLIREGRSRVMAKKAIGSLGAILATAMAAGRVGRNVVRDQERQGRRQNRLDKRHAKRLEVGVDIPTKDEIRAMLAAAQGRLRPFLVAAIFTGLRASELRGLRWVDVSLDGAELTVRGDVAHPRGQPLEPVVQLAAYPRRHSVGPGPLDEHAARQGVPGLGDTAASNRAPGRVLARHQAELGHQLPGIGEATEVADFRYDGDRHYKGDPAH